MDHAAVQVQRSRLEPLAVAGFVRSLPPQFRAGKQITELSHPFTIAPIGYGRTS